MESIPSPPSPSTKVIPKKPRWKEILIAHLLYWVIRLFSATVRFRLHEVHGHTDHFSEDRPAQPVIFCIWHNMSFLSIPIYQKYSLKPQPSRKMAVIVSASRDGSMMSYLLKLFGVESVRGSSSRRGAQAMVELRTLSKRGYDIAISPDGPRGPRYRVQPGVITLSQVTGSPLLPITYHLSHKITLKTWDQFQIPLPFSTCTVSAGKPFYIPKELTDTEREEWRTKVNQAMLAQTEDESQK